jgi:hypothetical protein
MLKLSKSWDPRFSGWRDGYSNLAVRGSQRSLKILRQEPSTAKVFTRIPLLNASQLGCKINGVQEEIGKQKGRHFHVALRKTPET